MLWAGGPAVGLWKLGKNGRAVGTGQDSRCPASHDSMVAVR